MDVVLTHGAWVDGHQTTVLACWVVPAPLGQPADGRLEGQAFGTRTRAVLALADGWSAAGLTPVARARTGASWQPVDHLLEGTWTVLLVHAAQVKNVPGRQTERADARWLAQRRRAGLLPASGIPPRRSGMGGT